MNCETAKKAYNLKAELYKLRDEVEKIKVYLRVCKKDAYRNLSITYENYLIAHRYPFSLCQLSIEDLKHIKTRKKKDIQRIEQEIANL